MKKRIVITSIAIVLIVVAAGVFTSKNILNYSSRALGRSVETNDINIDWGWPVTRISLANVEISNMEGGSDPVMLSVDKAAIGLNLFSLLKGTLAFDEVSLEKLER